MKHDFELQGCSEWSDDYKCSICGKEIRLAAEDSLSDASILAKFGDCQSAAPVSTFQHSMTGRIDIYHEG